MRCLINKLNKQILKLQIKSIKSSRYLFSSQHLNDNLINNDSSRSSKHLYAKIKSCGPISVADYMKEALTHPTQGYYMKRDVFGSKGDFITSPEISQLFGEMIGIWILNEWKKITNNNFQLVELGPGRGTLSKSILKIFNKFNLSDKMTIHLVEISPALSLIQSNNLCITTKKNLNFNIDSNNIGHYQEGITDNGVKVFWYQSIEHIPKKFSIFIAHEFFDALPIHKYQKNNNNTWSEIFIDIDPNIDNKFRFVMSKVPTLSSRLFISADEKRNHVEISLQTMIIIDYMTNFLYKYGGFSLIADYGHNGEKTDTFRAFKNHQQQDPLLNPGTADLTADVDFSMIKNTAIKNNKTIVFGPIEQRNFLLQMGIDVRLKILLNNINNDEEKKQLKSGYHMIIDDDKMGKCFKLLSIFPSILNKHLNKWPVNGFFNDDDDNNNNNNNKNNCN